MFDRSLWPEGRKCGIQTVLGEYTGQGWELGILEEGRMVGGCLEIGRMAGGCTGRGYGRRLWRVGCKREAAEVGGVQNYFG